MERLDPLEKETIISFNQKEKTARVFTYSKVWIKKLEQVLGFKPVYTNSHGGREYEVPKSMIKPPRKTRKNHTPVKHTRK